MEVDLRQYIQSQPMMKYARRIGVLSVLSALVAIIANTIMGYATYEAILLALSITAGSGINSVKEYYMIQSYAAKYTAQRYYTYQISMGALIALVSIPGAELILRGMGADPTVRPEVFLLEIFVIYLFFQEVFDTFLKDANVRFYKMEQGIFSPTSSVHNIVSLSPSFDKMFSVRSPSTKGSPLHVKTYWNTILKLSTGKGLLAIALSLIVRYPITNSQELWLSVLFGISYMSYALCQIGKDYAIVKATTEQMSRERAVRIWILLSLLRTAIAGPMAALVASGLQFSPNIGLPEEFVTFLNRNIALISGSAFALYTMIDQFINNKKQAAKLDLINDEIYAEKTIALFFPSEEELRLRTYVRGPDGTFYFRERS